MTIIHLIGMANGEWSPFDGQYLVEYDPARPSVAADGTQLPFTLVTTPDPQKATVFEMEAAFETWRRSHGIRADGKPNRPLTAWTCEFGPPPERKPQ